MNTQAHAPTDVALYETGLEWGKGRLVSVLSAVLSSIPDLSQSNGTNPEGPESDLGVQGGGAEIRSLQHFGLVCQSLDLQHPPHPPNPHPARSHAASCRRSPAELISTTSTYRSLAQCQAGRLRASGGCGALRRVQHSCGGRAIPSLAPPRAPFRKRTPVKLGGYHSLACQRWKKTARG